MSFVVAMPSTKFAPQSVIDGFKSYREAVVWCWENRGNSTADNKQDQAICANHIGLHTPHMSRCVNRDSLAPMNLCPDFLPDFQAFCGWHAVSQYIARTAQFTLMEEVIEERRHAA